jgi:hypothetical protein
MTERRVDTHLGPPETGALVEAARSDIVEGGAELNFSRHLPLGKIQQGASHSPPLGVRSDKNLVEPADIGFECEKADEAASGTYGNEDRPPGSELLDYASAHRGLAALLRDGETC